MIPDARISTRQQARPWSRQTYAVLLSDWQRFVLPGEQEFRTQVTMYAM